MKEQILVVSTYPPFGSLYNHPFSAVAAYTKNTLLASIKDNPDFSFLVLADKLEDEEKTTAEGKIKCFRCWERNDPKIFWLLLKEIYVRKNFKKILFAFEWAMFGKKKWLLGFLPFFLIILRLLGKKIYFVSHGVLLDADLVSEQMGVKKGSLKAGLWSIGLKVLYLSIVFLTQKVVVFEEHLRQKLLSLGNLPTKIITISHGVEEVKNKLLARKSREELKLEKNDLVVMSFGFLTWYKGSDWLIENMLSFFENNPQTNVKLYMVGGPTKTYEGDVVYQNYIKEIFELGKKAKGKIVITGFIEEKEIAKFYSASDLVILPYRVFLSSSGPLSLAFSYQKPVIFSRPLFNYCLTEDFKTNLKQTGLSMNDLVFDFSKEGLQEKILSLEKTPGLLKNIDKFVKLMNKSRAWSEIGKQYSNLLNN